MNRLTLTLLQLKITLSKTSVKPGESCKLSVSTGPDSFVSLLGVDQSVTLLGTGNDIDRERFNNEMSAYSVHENHDKLRIKGNDDGRYLDLGESNAFLITNAMDGEKTCNIDERTVTGEVRSPNDDDESGIVENEDIYDPDNPQIRKNFAETWIFEDFPADENGKYSDDFKVPDTITSFIVTGFATSHNKGLAIAQKQKITVFQEFFIKLFVPFSIRLGEVLKVDVTVFNYISKQKRKFNVKVTMFNDEGQFVFVDATANGRVCNIVEKAGEEKQTKSVDVPSDDGASTHFLIRALVTGDIQLKVRASATTSIKDEVEITIKVEHEGITKTDNVPYLIDLRDKSTDSFEFSLPIPSLDEGTIWKSIHIEASAVGDLLGLGSSLQNVQNLM
jgi:CD109 antigen